MGQASPDQITQLQTALHANPQYQAAWQRLQDSLQHLPELVEQEGIGQGSATRGPGGNGPEGDSNQGQDPIDMARQVVMRRFADDTKGLIQLPKDYMINPMDGGLTYVPPDHAGRNQILALAAFFGGSAIAAYVGGLGAAAPTMASEATGVGATTAATGAVAPAAAGVGAGAGAGAAGTAGTVGTLAATATVPAVTSTAAVPGLVSGLATPAATSGVLGTAGKFIGSNAGKAILSTAGTVASSYLSSKAARDAAAAAAARTPEELALIKSQTALADQARTQSAALYKTAVPAVTSTLDYYKNLLSGNRSARFAAVSPEAQDVAAAYKGADASVKNNLRGGERDQALAENARQRAGGIARLTTGVRPQAASALSSEGTSLLNTASGGTSAAGGIYSGLIANETGNRMNANQIGQEAGATTGKTYGSLIADLLSMSRPKSSSSNLAGL